MRAALIAAIALLAAVPMATAEVEKYVDVDHGCANAAGCFYWWPKVVAPSGWHHDEDASRQNTSNILVPDGKTFADAETIMYARSPYKPRLKSVASLAQFIAQDKADTLKALPGTIVADGAPMTDGDGKVLKTVTFSPPAGGHGSWERLAYSEEGDFYLLFVISSHSTAGLAKDMKAFESLIASYKEKP